MMEECIGSTSVHTVCTSRKVSIRRVARGGFTVPTKKILCDCMLYSVVATVDAYYYLKDHKVVYWLLYINIKIIDYDALLF